MGLCKCPKKVVTNQFCFEHRVNVCENCMVKNHTKCVVQSYLLWLEDSDYDSKCQLCKTELIDGDCIRLICYHLFHYDCLNKFASSLPPHTAPAGYTCPTCNLGIFPPSNMVSPVAEALRNTLLGVNWARCGLAFPLVDEPSPSTASPPETESSPRKAASAVQDHSKKAIELKAHYANVAQAQLQIDGNRSSRPEPYGASFATGPFVAPRKLYDSTEFGRYQPMDDPDEDKYKRRSAFEWFARWFRSRSPSFRNRRKDASIVYKKWMVLGMLGLIALCTLVILFIRMGRSHADADPMLDPHLNPNIRIEDTMDVLEGGVKALEKENVVPPNGGANHILRR